MIAHHNPALRRCRFIGPCRMVRYPDYKVTKHNMYQKADPAGIKKNMAQTLHSCTISPCRPTGEPSPTRQRGEKTKKYGANAPQLHHILYLSRTNPGDAKKYGANAPQLHHIFPVANQPDNQGFSKVAQPAHRNRHHCKGGGSGVGRWTLAVALPALSLSSPYQAITRSWHCQEHSAILLYTAESTCSFCLEHFPYYSGKIRRATNGVLVAKNFSGGGWSGRIGWPRILYTDASPTFQDQRRIATARPT